MSQRMIGILTASVFAVGTLSGWLLQQSATAETSTTVPWSSKFMEDEVQFVPFPSVEESNPQPESADPNETSVDETSTDNETLAEQAEEEDGVATEEEIAEEDLEEIVVELPVRSDDETGEDDDDAREDRQTSAEERVLELEERLEELESIIEALLAWRAEVEEFMTRAEDTVGELLETNLEREMSLEARSRRDHLLAGLETELHRVSESLARGSTEEGRALRAVDETLARLAAEARDLGHLTEAERIEAASLAVRASLLGLANRDLHAARTALSLAGAHIGAARALTRTMLGP